MTKMGSASFWDQRFSAEGKIWGEVPSRTVRRAIELFRSSSAHSVLVLGCGYGRNAEVFAREGFAVIGLDQSSEALAIARQAAPEVRWVEGSALDSEAVEGSFDAVYAFNLLHLFLAAGRRQLIDNCRQWLLPGGILYAAAFSEMDFSYGRGEQVEPNTFESRPGRPAHYFNESDLREHFAAFEILETGLVEDPEDHPPDGPHVHQLLYVAARAPR
jgi:SAM-dependent methyltransferase